MHKKRSYCRKFNRGTFIFYIGSLTFLLAIFSSCETDYTPKPRGFFRIDFPPKSYRPYESNCPFRFEIPGYSSVEQDSFPGAQPCWLNIQFPSFRATLHLSYRRVEQNLRQLTEDSRTLAMKHSAKAEEISENPFFTPRHIFGLRYDIMGNAASPVQFYLTDSTQNFLRGSLYFNVTPEADSLAPVLSFIGKDINRFLQTFEWK